MTQDTPPGGDGGWQPVGGVWEPETTWFCRDWLRPGMTFVDAGAHVGYYTLLASDRVADGGRVIAFEPHPMLGQVLRRNVGRAGRANVTVSPLALGRAAGTAGLVLHTGDNHGASSLRPDSRTAHLPRAQVEMTTLDDYLERDGVTTVDVLKLDVEGAELDVIDGARRTLAASPGIVLVVEFLRENARRFGRDLEALEARLRDLGFALFTLTQHGPRRDERVGEEPVNVVAVRGLPALLRGLPEATAAATLVELARTWSGHRPPG